MVRGAADSVFHVDNFTAFCKFNIFIATYVPVLLVKAESFAILLPAREALKRDLLSPTPLPRAACQVAGLQLPQALSPGHLLFQSGSGRTRERGLTSALGSGSSPGQTEDQPVIDFVPMKTVYLINGRMLSSP